MDGTTTTAPALPTPAAIGKAVVGLIFGTEAQALMPLIAQITAWRAANPNATPVELQAEALSIFQQFVAAQPSVAQALMNDGLTFLLGISQTLGEDAPTMLTKAQATFTALLAAVGAKL